MSEHPFGKPEGGISFLSTEIAAGTVIFGVSCTGRSRLLQQIADHQGVSYEEIVRSCEPTPEELERRRAEREEANMKEEKRLMAVREAFWLTTASDDSELSPLHDSLVSQIPGVTEVSYEQKRILFMMLPASIIGGAISWGLDDTEVRDEVYVFVRDNIVAVKAALGIEA